MIEDEIFEEKKEVKILTAFGHYDDKINNSFAER